ncbi:MAG TPA: hypothetical protein IGS17_21650 [Oscillatoriales cyanobacterium M59_W2019_021]|nr:MAG: hypothetical protein D6728_18400 [Cyanobacteria bacterium J055]HIK33300.1 hypothetical protein [Oscillatoriales cyanobacterium M4454_W2019_049]HIK53496.1 hypothetical protein [Oscillatoriales cyanobacterium M59_W2019_021]
MAGALDRIERDVAALEEAIATIATEFDRAYASYREILGRAARQQLILACFHICTQAYPESFLKLNFSQREHLQQKIRQIADWGKQELEQLGGGIHSELQADETPTATDPFPEELVDTDSMLSLPTPNEPFEEDDSSLSPPERVMSWQQQMEMAIAQILQTLSDRANRLLQQSGILTERLPATILEAAKAEGLDAVGGVPNLLNLTIETENAENPDLPNVTHIVAINLRLAEIELAEPNCSAWRTQIRQLSHRLKSLAQQYERKRNEQAVAQAESAWRSSWFDG